VRLLLAANPRSGGATDPDRIARLLEHGRAQVDRVALDDLDAAAVRDAGVQRLVVAGGDGSIGVAAEAALGAGVALAVVPTGTANDFARATGLPEDLEAAAALAADPGARTRPFELGRMDGRPFVNVATAGVSVLAAKAAHPLKSRLGPLAYTVGALRAGATAQRAPATVEVDGAEVFSGEAWQVAVAATGHFGGGSAVGGTDPHDRRLDVVVVRDRSRAALARRALGMRLGRLAGQDGVLAARGREVAVRGPVSFNVDGELCECHEDGVRFTVEDRRVEVVVGDAA
jgi:YegS/Rv2252/BmrU family lipid kinase